MPDQAIIQDSLIGQEFGHYRILERIGNGGMGVVYRALDEHLDREVAIKVLPLGTLADDASRRRFRREALILSKLSHPNIATIHDFDTQRGLDFLVMEYIPGVTLDDKLAAGSLSEKQVLTLGTQLAEGLSAAHEQAVVHRDLKPGNLRLTPEGRLKILDFGLAMLRASSLRSATSETLSETHAMLGTLPYMAPEQVIGGEIDARTDIHATGAVLYEMATGQRVFPMEGRSQITSAILRGSPPPASNLNPRLTPELSRIISKCLEKEPENRYQLAQELAIDLRRLQSGVQNTGQSPVTAAPRRYAMVIGLSLLVLAFVVTVLLAFNISNTRQRLFNRAKPLPIESLAVLPLENLSGDREQDYFADGITGELITQLSKIRALRVISRTSVMRFKNSNTPLPEIARQLEVDAVMEGSIIRSGNRVRINAQLLTADDAHLWAESFDRDLRDILSLSSEVTSAIAERVRAQLTPQERQQLAERRVVNEEAYDAYLQGQFFAQRGEYKKAAQYFESATQKEPEFVSAWYNLAEAYAMMDFLEGNYIGARARDAGDKVMQLAPESAEAYIIRGDEQFFRHWKWKACEREFGHAVDLAPRNVPALGHYALCLSALGRYDAARQVLERAKEVDPLSPKTYREIGDNFDRAHQPEYAITHYRRAADLDAQNASLFLTLGRVYDETGMTVEARDAYLQAIRVSSLSADETKTQEETLTRRGSAALRRQIAAGQLERLKQRARSSEVSPYLFARWYTALGQKDEAFKYLEQAYRERLPNLTWLATNREWDCLRSDPRFADLLRRVNSNGQ